MVVAVNRGFCVLSPQGPHRTYPPAHYGAGVACVIAAALALTIGRPRAAAAVPAAA